MSSNEESNNPSSQINLENIWPQERDFMERPERYKYVRKLVNPQTCVFCDSQKMGPQFESLCLYQTKHAMVLLNKYPYNSGHLLVLPVRHCGDITELSQEEYQGVSALLFETVKVVKKVYSCEGLNLGMNHGRVAGAGIPDHLHWHVIPRWHGDTNFFPLIAETKAMPETLEQSYNKLSPNFQELKL